jgi:hypothetical protein
MADILTSYAIKLHGKPIGNYRVHRRYHIALVLSTIIGVSGIASLVLAVYADEVGYGVLTNILALSGPFVLYFSYRSKNCAIIIFRAYHFICVVSIVIFAILDSILLGQYVSAYRYCFGDLTEYCIQDKEDRDEYECRAEFDRTYEEDDKTTSVTCTGEAIIGMFIAALMLNLISYCVQVPFFLISTSIRRSLHQQIITGTEPPEDLVVRSKEATVILREGVFLPPDSEYSCIGEPHISESGLEQIDIHINDSLCSDHKN